MITDCRIQEPESSIQYPKLSIIQSESVRDHYKIEN